MWLFFTVGQRTRRPQLITYAVGCNFARKVMDENIWEDVNGNLRATLPWLTVLPESTISSRRDGEKTVATDYVLAYGPKTIPIDGDSLSKRKVDMELKKAAYMTFYGVEHILEVL